LTAAVLAILGTFLESGRRRGRSFFQAALVAAVLAILAAL